MSSAAAFFTEPFVFAYMQKAFLITLVLALPMALISCLVVLKGWALMGDAMTHAVLPGIVLAYLIGLPLAAGAFLAGLFAAIAIGWVDANSRIKRDTAMGIVFSGLFGLGLVMFVAVRANIHLDHILFGDMLGVSWADVIEAALLSALTGLALYAKRRDLTLTAFDEMHARAIGLPVSLLHYGLLTAIAVMIVASLKSVGIILSIALIVAPGAIAALVSRRLPQMFAAAAGSVVFAAVAGIFASYHLDSEPAPTMVLVLSILFIAALGRSLLIDRRRRRIA